VRAFFSIAQASAPLSTELTTDSPCPGRLLERLRCQQPLHRGPDDGQRRGEDQHAFETAGEVLGLVVAVGVVVVGRALGDDDHRQREQRTRPG
jgi:hypothetical protein